jgi:hypothetical protein
MFRRKWHHIGAVARLRTPAGVHGRPAAAAGARRTCRAGGHRAAARGVSRGIPAGRALLLRLALPLLAILAAVVGTVPAQAAPAPLAEQTLMNVGTGGCLGAHYNTSSGGTDLSMYVQFCSGLDGNAWQLVPRDGSGDYQIVANDRQFGQQCLEASYAGSSKVWVLYALPCSETSLITQWHVTPDPAAGSSAPNQIAVTGTSQCLQGTGSTSIQLASCDGDAYEQWQRTQTTGFETTSELQNGASGLCLARDPGVSASPVKVTGCVSYGGNDVWHLVQADHFGDWHIVDTYTGWCLDSDYNGSVATRACNGGNFQTWQATPTSTNGSAPMAIKDAATGLCLGAGSTWAYTQSCNGSSSQNWAQSTSPWDTGSFNLQNKNAPGKCVGTDAYSGIASLWPCTTHPDQVWHWEISNPQGYAELVDGYGNCLSVQSGSTGQGAQILSSPCTGSADQYWARTSGLYLENFKSHLVMGVLGASTATGAPIVQWSMNTSTDQHWYLS